MSRFRAAACLFLTVGLVATLAASTPSAPAQPDPEPRAVTPGACDSSKPCPPPSDAIVLFDGSNLDAWQTTDAKPAPWTIENGAATINGKGSVVTRQKFADAQIHVEFATPVDVSGNSQERGNSGVYLQGRYEVQVLDSFNNPTNPKGSCGAVYSQHAPLVNASRAPGQWQTFDIIFRAARFDADGKKTANARVTVIHNAVLVQDNAEISGTTGSAPNKESPDPGYLYLQDHGNPVKYRNIWIRPL